MIIFLVTKNTTPIIGQISTLMGFIMDGIYRVLSAVGIQNIGLCIIIFGIIIYALMTPLQIKQQKFSKMSAVMNPEIQKIQKKYQGKKDQDSMQRMQEETQAVYAKYGVSATGSCVQLLVQLPVLWALWQVIYKIPAYVGSVQAIFTEAVNKIISVDGFTEILRTFITDNRLVRVSLQVAENGEATKNSVIDFLYALSPAQWKLLSGMSEFSSFSGTLDSTAAEISRLQNFCGLNISEQPIYYITNFKTVGIGLAIVALMIPILSWATQMLNIKLMPNPSSQNAEGQDAMGSSMKTMNTVMPLMSAVFCFTFPVGLGIYWIASAVVRSIQMVIINKQLDKIDIDEMVKANQKKYEEKRAKQGLPPQKITTQAHQSVRNINTAKNTRGVSGNQGADKAQKVDRAYENARKAKAGSITAKANMVRDFEERNKKK